MKQETKLQLLDKLRKENPELVKKIMTVEDLSNYTTEREAFRAARGKGILKFLYTGTDGKRKQKTTRLKTETEMAHLEAMIERAKKSQTTGEPAAEPLLEAKIRPNALKKIILQEINSVISDILKKKKNA